MEYALTYTMVVLILFFLVSWLFIALVLYIMPTVIAYLRKHRNIWPIFILNLFLGWTFLGWLASLLWSLNSDVESDED